MTDITKYLSAMKKILLILTFIVVVSMKGEAQHFTASFGVTHSWDVPVHVTRVISHDYYGYDVVHATQIRRGGGLFFDLVLQRGDVFVEVNVRHDGYVIDRVYHDYYPLHEHVCSNYCGYHTTYYRSHYRTCNSHSHHGHNHVVYVNRPVGHGHGHGHGHGNGHKHTTHYVHKGDSYHKNDNHRNDRYDSRSNHNHGDKNYRERRSTYHEEKHNNNRGRGNGHGSYKGRSEKNGRSYNSGTLVRRSN